MLKIFLKYYFSYSEQHWKKPRVQTNYFHFTRVTFIYIPDTVTQMNLINQDLIISE